MKSNWFKFILFIFVLSLGLTLVHTVQAMECNCTSTLSNRCNGLGEIITEKTTSYSLCYPWQECGWIWMSSGTGEGNKYCQTRCTCNKSSGGSCATSSPAGPCLEKPTGSRYYDNPTYPRVPVAYDEMTTGCKAKRHLEAVPRENIEEQINGAIEMVDNKEYMWECCPANCPGLKDLRSDFKAMGKALERPLTALCRPVYDPETELPENFTENCSQIYDDIMAEIDDVTEDKSCPGLQDPADTGNLLQLNSIIKLIRQMYNLGDILGPQKGGANIYLPVKLDWNDVLSWHFSGGSYIYQIKIEGEMRDCEALEEIDELKEKIKEETDPEIVWGHREEIKEIRNGTHPDYNYEREKYEEPLDKSEWTPPCSCMFKSNRTYKWKVRACCDESVSDTACGPWSDWQFTTNPAPEPKWPYDPDWNGPGKVEGIKAEEIPAAISVQWCPFTDCDENHTEEACNYYAPEKYGIDCYWDYNYGECHALSHKFLTYLIENDNENCHPFLVWEGNQCYPSLLKLGKLGGLNLAYHPNKFSNEIYQYFTKNFIYSWKAAACKDGTAKDCTEFGQKWKFSLADFPLELIQIVFPPNDFEGEIPIGLPLTVEWKATLGTMSYRYEIYEKESGIKIETGTGTSSGPAITLNSPSLNLNTIYKWRIKPCWGYYAEPEKCDDDWSDFFYFKTTGQPPELTYPEKDVSEPVVIPVTFEWENVPGAKSYVFKINGEEKAVHQSKLTLDYPELLQETNYSWQVKTCAKDNGELCGDYSTPQSFATFKLQPPDNPKPGDGSTISTTATHLFSWNEIVGAKYYQFEITYLEKSPEEIREDCSEKEGKTTTKIVSGNSIYYPLECNGEYQWKARGCLDKECSEGNEGSAGIWSAPWTFTLVSKKTTQEVLEETLKEAFINEVFPEIFENVPETAAEGVSKTAKSISEEILGLEATKNMLEKIITGLSGAVDVSEISENLEGEFNTAWKDVVTEASTTPEASTVLGIMEGKLKTVLEDIKTQISGVTVVWEALTIVENNLNEATIGMPGEVKKKVSDKVLEATKDMPQNLLEEMLEIISEEILKISEIEEIPEKLEPKFYEVWDKESQKAIQKASAMPGVPENLLEQVLDNMKADVWNNIYDVIAEKFPEISKKVEIRKGGLVPCGRTSKNPDTPWDETEPCGIKHIFIMIKVIIDFLLTKIAPLFLVLLAVATGLIFYFSLGGANVMSQVKSLWKAAGIGYLLLIFSWLIISWILTIFGYNVGIFGIVWPWQ